MSDSPDTSIHSKLTEQLVGVFDSAASARREHYAGGKAARPTVGDVDAIISSYANTNMAIAGAASLVPGPWGLLAVVPEIVLIIRNQVKMVYDIGVAYGKEDVLTRELILGITMSATGTGAMGLLTMHGSKVLVKRSALRVFQRIVAVFAGRVTQRLLKSMIAKWLPVVGAIALGLWTRSSTAAVGHKAKEILAKDIEFVDDDSTDAPEDRASGGESTAEIATVRLRLLCNLVKVDGVVVDPERTYLRTLLDRAPIDEAARVAIWTSLDDPQQHPVNLEPLEGEADEVFGLLVDMAAMAWRDGELHPAEVLYVRRVASRLGFPEVEVNALLTRIA